MNTQFFTDGQWHVTPVVEGTKTETYGEIASYGSAIGYMQWHYPCTCSCYHLYPTKSAREQVIDEILTKMADAVSKDDFKQAKKFAQLAKAVKEL